MPTLPFFSQGNYVVKIKGKADRIHVGVDIEYEPRSSRLLLTEFDH